METYFVIPDSMYTKKEFYIRIKLGKRHCFSTQVLYEFSVKPQNK